MEEVHVSAHVRLSVCLLAGLLKNVCMDLDEMLHVDRCQDMDEQIKFWAQSGSQSECRNRIAFSDIVYVLLWGILRREIPGVPLQWATILKWFYSLRRRT